MGKKIRRELIEIGIFLSVLAVIYLTGWQTEIAGFLQRGIMLTGLHNAKVTSPVEQTPADLNFKVKTLDGEFINLSSLEGKTIFMNFWATWCAPCVAEMPSIEALWEENKQDNIAFLLVSTDDEIDKIKAFIKRKGYSFPVYQMASPLPSTFKASAIPATFVVSPEGNLVYKHIGIANYDTSDFHDFLDDITKGI